MADIPTAIDLQTDLHPELGLRAIEAQFSEERGRLLEFQARTLRGAAFHFTGHEIWTREEIFRKLKEIADPLCYRTMMGYPNRAYDPTER